MGCNQSKAADAVVQQDPTFAISKEVGEPQKPPSNTIVVVPVAEAIQTVPTASPTNSAGPTTDMMEEKSLPMEHTVLTGTMKETKEDATAIDSAVKAAVVVKEELPTKEQASYDEAVKELENALLISPRNAANSESPTTTISNEEAVKELEESLRRVRSEEEKGDMVESTKPVEVKMTETQIEMGPVPIDEATSLVDEDATENVPPVASTKLCPEGRKCAKCNAVEKASGAFKTCAKCRGVYYCNKACQKAHFKVHKKTCCKTESKTKITNANLNHIQINS